MHKQATDYDAVVVGSGPNGLAAGIVLQQKGLSVLLLEAKPEIGGGLRSAELTLPGYLHDVCSAVHPLAVGSPFFQSLPLAAHGLDFIYPPVSAAHPLDGGSNTPSRQSDRDYDYNSCATSVRGTASQTSRSARRSA